MYRKDVFNLKSEDQNQKRPKTEPPPSTQLRKAVSEVSNWQFHFPAKHAERRNEVNSFSRRVACWAGATQQSQPTNERKSMKSKLNHCSEIRLGDGQYPSLPSKIA